MTQISNTQKIIVKKKRKETTAAETLFSGSGSLLSAVYGTDSTDAEDDAWDDSTLMDNQRFKKLCRLPQLGVYVDEAHHLFGADLEKQIRSSGANKTSLRDTINLLAANTSIVACYNYTGTVKEKNIDYLQENMKYSEYSLAGEVARYLNISCILAAKILRESVDGADVILDAVNRYNAVLDDYIIPGVFHALFDITAELKTEDKELVLLREPKEAGYYEFSAKDDLVITNRYPGFTPDQIKKSFHADTYCFDSIPEKECFMQYITSGKVKEVYFTGMFTSNQGDLSVHYYDPESGRIRQYYPDFLAKMTDGSYQLIEVKGDNKIDDTVVKAKQAAAEEMAIASGIKYLMYAGSQIVNSHVLEDASDTASTISMC